MKSLTRLTLERALKKINPEIFTKAKSILDVGASYAPYKNLFPKANYKTLDINPDVNPDYCCDIHHMTPIKTNSLDLVLATEVLEHCENPFLAVKEIHRTLQKNGHCVLSTRFLFGFHGDAKGDLDYFRFTKGGLKKVFSPFSQVNVYPLGSVQSATWDLMTLYIWPFKPLMILNQILIHFIKDKEPHTSGYLVIAKK